MCCEESLFLADTNCDNRRGQSTKCDEQWLAMVGGDEVVASYLPVAGLVSGLDDFPVFLVLAA